ncbi:MAG TPA: lysophospholipid acyltransferase family protein [Candidatus Kapabacteria bacterium]|nr:lysophospholipid acyltransferase family protein [Candidatus Kapabacteria bacterium]
MRSIIAATVFIVVTIIFSIISIPAALVDRSGRTYCVVARLWSRIFLTLFDISVSVNGSENVLTSEHYVFAANHSSYTDIPVLFVAIPKDVRLVLRHTLTRIPIWGWALLVGPFIIINRASAPKAKKSLNRAVEIIKGGASVLLFPEGTRTHDGKVQSFKRGAFHLAYESGAKVIPVSVRGTFDVMTRFDKLPKTHKHVTVTIGKPLSVNTNIEGDRDREMDLMKRAEEVVAANLSF